MKHMKYLNALSWNTWLVRRSRMMVPTAYSGASSAMGAIISWIHSEVTHVICVMVGVSDTRALTSHSHTASRGIAYARLNIPIYNI